MPQLDEALSAATEEGGGEGWTPGDTIYWGPAGLGEGETFMVMQGIEYNHLTCAHELKLRRLNVLCCKGEANPVHSSINH